MSKVTKILLSASLILSLSTIALAEDGNATDKQTNNDINGIKFLLGGGLGTSISAHNVKDGDEQAIRFSGAGLNTKLTLGTGIFTTTANSTLGLQATLGVGVNKVSSSFYPQYSFNLDFIQAFKIGNGHIKLGYIAGVGLAIRNNDAINSGSGEINTPAQGTPVASTRVNQNAALLALLPYLMGNGLNGGSSTNSFGTSSITPSFTSPSFSTPTTIISPAASNANSAALSEANARLSAANAQINQLRGTISNLSSVSQMMSSNINNLQNIINQQNDELTQKQKEYIGTFNQTEAARAVANSLRAQVSEQLAKANDAGNFIRTNRGTAQPLTDFIDPDTGEFRNGKWSDNLFTLGVGLANIRERAKEIRDARAALAKLDPEYEVASQKYGGLVSTRTAQGQTINVYRNTIDILKNQLTSQQDIIKRYQDIINSAQNVVAQLQSATIAKDDAATQKLIAQSKEVIANAQSAIAEANTQAKKQKDALVALAATQDSKRAKTAVQANETNPDKTPSIMPTIKLGLIAFIGKNQSISLEYQHYFRNTNANFGSSDITLNYTYYFGN
ncbi:hypothetical protein [Helicobacter sp. 11S02629-2]|uniref:hypothetical protein n=1 Tax=Helicobacter sp. 11S02629-2 TaxID=1476195 RepID=UPI000BA65292|nr:hypothetical protein [Helicobacter sp. 11S02629-2]PAF45865.1 hypothetical protein BKH40_00155 [Helicobacter sp. 11S02629-2]